MTLRRLYSIASLGGVTALILPVLLSVLISNAHAANDVEVEHKVKAACIFNFARFVEWPPGSYADDDAPLRICLLDSPEIATVMEEVHGKQLRDRTVTVEEVTRSTSKESLQQCQILVVPNDDISFLKSIESELPTTLTVTEDDPHGMMNLFITKGKVRFDIDLRQAQKAGLEVNGRLLMVANEVKK